MNPRITAALLFLAAAPAAVAQTTYTFTTFTVPNASYTDTVGINERGDVSGYYGVPSTGLFLGFLRRSSGEFITISYPGQSATAVYGLNDSLVVAGNYSTGNSVGGMLYYDGAYRSIVIEGQSTAVNDINDQGYYAGSYGSPSSSGFIASPSGQITTLNYPGAYATGVNWIKNNGSAIGTYEDSFGKLHTFVWSAKLGYRAVSIPGVPGATIGDINASGVMVGGYFNGVTDRGFVYQNGEFQIVLPPGASDSAISAINNKGQLAGVYSIAAVPGNVGFIATPVTASASKGVSLR